MHNDCTRRQWLGAAAGAALTRPFAPAVSAAASSMGPTPRVAIAKCPTYGAELLPAMQRMFDQLGGLGLLESCWSSSGPLEEFMLQVNWEPRDLASTAPRVEFENTNYLGRARKYV